MNRLFSGGTAPPLAMIEAYARDLREFTTWLGRRSPTTLSIRELGDYLAALDGRGLARASVARRRPVACASSSSQPRGTIPRCCPGRCSCWRA